MEMLEIMELLTYEVINNNTHCDLQLTNKENNLTIALTHYHERYNYNNDTLRIQGSFSDERKNDILHAMILVINGENFIDEVK